MSSSAVDITLLGRTYSIACPAGQEPALRNVADKLEKQLLSLKARTNNLSREEIAIMAALNIGYELFEEKQNNQEYNRRMDERIALLQATIENALVERERQANYTAKPDATASDADDSQ
ncbi:cell division protein ZapA [Shewanella sp. NFH-SH190041]|uniref:cell division protein ZapA n=1 Tax=Shewanella sp. NFH-SH190041 TaxID=2950245 RepID=UPI0021C2732A|nr:cell division protein ZapA [Shewanella sp. NFH-SH190041]BDM65468.1 cell division protein ZapA [Shewanella sp. NFH-SH190041]